MLRRVWPRQICWSTILRCSWFNSFPNIKDVELIYEAHHPDLFIFDAF
jgi:hypothetical protein